MNASVDKILENNIVDILWNNQLLAQYNFAICIHKANLRIPRDPNNQEKS